MAYLGKIEPHSAMPIDFAAIARPTLEPEAQFSELEWSVIDLAQLDRLWTVRPLGAVRRFLNWLTNRANPALANERLEALRRMAVLTWHFGSAVRREYVTPFFAAGFTHGQYKLLANSIEAASREGAVA